MGSYDLPYLMCDKRLLKNSIFKDAEIVDTLGVLHFFEDIEPISGILIGQSIKRIGLMVKIQPIIKKNPENITLDVLKERIKKNVVKNKQQWSGLNDGRGVVTMIDETQSFEELILLFR